MGQEAKHQAIAESPANGVRRHKHPLGTRGIGRAETFQLVNEWVHVRLQRRRTDLD